MNDQKNHYQTLQVAPQAEAEVVEAAYKRLARKYHPDVNGSVDANARMQEINEAYAVLGNVDKRAEYDKHLARQRATQGQSTPNDQSQRSQQTHGSTQRQQPPRTDEQPSGSSSTPPPRASYIELKFQKAWTRLVPDIHLATEYEVFGGRYRIDFAHPQTQIGAELDGREYHTDPKAFTRDRQRDRELQQAGWRILHFSGYEINQDVERCVYEVQAAIENQLRTTATPSTDTRSKPKQQRRSQEAGISREFTRQSLPHTKPSTPAHLTEPHPPSQQRSSWYALPAFVSSCLATLGITLFSCIGIIMLSSLLLVGTCWGISAGLRAATSSLEASAQQTGPRSSIQGGEQSQDRRARIAVPALNVRQKPGVDAEKIGKLFQNEQVIILEEETFTDGTWLRVRRDILPGSPPLEGWVNAQYLEVEVPPR